MSSVATPYNLIENVKRVLEGLRSVHNERLHSFYIDQLHWLTIHADQLGFDRSEKDQLEMLLQIAIGMAEAMEILDRPAAEESWE